MNNKAKNAILCVLSAGTLFTGAVTTYDGYSGLNEVSNCLNRINERDEYNQYIEPELQARYLEIIGKECIDKIFVGNVTAILGGAGVAASVLLETKENPCETAGSCEEMGPEQ